MKVFSVKRKELSQALSLLVRSIRTEKGCKHCYIYNSVEDKNEFCLFGGWENRKDLDNHLESELFKVFLGAMNFLKKPHEMKFYVGLPTAQSPDMAGELSLSGTTA